MTKTLTGREGATLGIESSVDMYAKLMHESERLRPDWHPYDAFNFLVTAWHLFNDWPKSDPPRALNRLKRQRSRAPKEMNLVLDVTRDLVNGSKHFYLKPDDAEKRRVDRVHTGTEVGFYQYFFHEDLAAVTVEEHWYFSIRVLHNLIMRYFEWVFDDSAPLNNFPEELVDALLYCNIAKRRSGPSPAVWLQNIESARRRRAKGLDANTRA